MEGNCEIYQYQHSDGHTVFSDRVPSAVMPQGFKTISKKSKESGTIERFKIPSNEKKAQPIA